MGLFQALLDCYVHCYLDLTAVAHGSVRWIDMFAEPTSSANILVLLKRLWEASKKKYIKYMWNEYMKCTVWTTVDRFCLVLALRFLNSLHGNFLSCGRDFWDLPRLSISMAESKITPKILNAVIWLLWELAVVRNLSFKCPFGDQHLDTLYLVYHINIRCSLACAAHVRHVLLCGMWHVNRSFKLTQRFTESPSKSWCFSLAV